MTFEREDPAAKPGTGPGAEAGADAGIDEHLATTDHEVIRQWAKDRHATPATLEGAERDGRLDVLRFDFGFDMVEAEDDQLREVSWDEWLAAFDEQRLSFVYQEARSDGSRSNFFRFEQRAGETP